MYGNVFKCKQSSLCSLCCKLRLFGRFYKRKMSKSQYVNHLFGPVSNSKNTLVSALCTEQKSDALFPHPVPLFLMSEKLTLSFFVHPKLVSQNSIFFFFAFKKALGSKMASTQKSLSSTAFTVNTEVKQLLK